MRRRRSPQSQPRIAGVRRLLQSAALEARIMDRVLIEARRYNVSRSFVVAVALADALSIDLDEAFRYHEKNRRAA